MSGLLVALKRIQYFDISDDIVVNFINVGARFSPFGVIAGAGGPDLEPLCLRVCLKATSSA